jgi:hypothetical protein
MDFPYARFLDRQLGFRRDIAGFVCNWLRLPFASVCHLGLLPKEGQKG